MKIPGFLVAPVLIVFAASVARAEETALARYDDFAAGLRATAAASNGAASVAVIGKSSEGREILAVAIGLGEGADGRPALLVIGGVEGDQPAGAELAAALVTDLATAKDERTRKLLAERTVYVIPRLNPDGLERFFAPLRRADAGTARAWDEDRDGAADEDGPDDLDGDGAIAWMRVEDPAGEWVADATDAGLMRRANAAKGERPTHRILVEGRDDDGDGAWNEDGPGGIDLNSSFTWNYRPHAARTGPYQMSEPEARALADFVIAHPNIEAAFTFASNDNCVRQAAPAAPPDPLPGVPSPLVALDPADTLHFARAAELYRGALGRDRADAGPLRDGGVAEWLYFHRGILSLASPGWSVPAKHEKSPEGVHEDGKAKDERAAFRWLRANRAEAWVEWRAVEHPDFPGKKVEVGGWRAWAREPAPAAEMPALVLKHGEFARRLLEQFPRIGIRETKVKALGEGLWEVVATVFNDGELPTALSHGTRSGRARAVRVDLVLDGATLVSGKDVTLVKALTALNGQSELRWVVKGPAGARVSVKAETDKAGQAEWSGELK